MSQNIRSKVSRKVRGSSPEEEGCMSALRMDSAFCWKGVWMWWHRSLARRIVSCSACIRLGCLVLFHVLHSVTLEGTRRYEDGGKGGVDVLNFTYLENLNIEVPAVNVSN